MKIGRALVSEASVIVPVTLTKASSAKIGIYSILGKQIMSLNSELQAGENTLSLDKANLPAGRYMISVQIGAQRSLANFNVAR